MIDPVLITRKLNLILNDLASLEGFAELTLEQYLDDPLNVPAAERYLERVIGRMIDVNYHIVTETGAPPPKDYYESFTELGRLKVLPIEFSRNTARSAGLRNRLVHEYDVTDDKIVFEAISLALSDIPEYVRHIRLLTR